MKQVLALLFICLHFGHLGHAQFSLDQMEFRSVASYSDKRTILTSVDVAGKNWHQVRVRWTVPCPRGRSILLIVSGAVPMDKRRWYWSIERQFSGRQAHSEDPVWPEIAQLEKLNAEKAGRFPDPLPCSNRRHLCRDDAAAITR